MGVQNEKEIYLALLDLCKKVKKGKTMKNVKIISFALITQILACCNGNSFLPEPITYNPLIPLGVGNYWLYRGYTLNPDDGSVIFPDQYRFGFIIHNPSEQIINGEKRTYYQMSFSAENLKPLDDSQYSLYGGSKLVYQTKNGFYFTGIVRKDTIVMTFSDLIFPNPAIKGESVNGHVFYYNNSGNTSNVPYEATTKYTCVSTDSLFTTPLGDFRCIVYKMAWQDFEPLFRDEVYYFIKPGIGIIGMVNMVYHYSLKKYRYIRKILLTDYKIE